MKTEVRFLLAVVLMLVVLIGTNRLFPPVVPEDAGLPVDSAISEVDEREPVSGLPDEGERSEARGPTDTGRVAVPPPGPATEADVVVAEAPELEVTVEGPLYRLTFSSVGARMLAAELPQFIALNHGGVVQLVPEGAGGYFGHRLVVGSDTLDLSNASFRVEPEEGLRLQEGGAPQALRFTYAPPAGAFRFEIEYTFDPDL
jgi:YidC/Oxa1 family membrane protein insertase